MQCLKLQFAKECVTGFMDGREVLSVNDSLYARGMAGVLAGKADAKLGRPFFDNVMIKAADAQDPAAQAALVQTSSIYQLSTK